MTQAGNEELLTTLVENYMGKDSNFSFMILDSDKYRIAASGDDAKERIEGSNHYVALSNTDGQTTVQSPIAGKLLNKDEWTEKLAAASNNILSIQLLTMNLLSRIPSIRQNSLLRRWVSILAWQDLSALLQR